MSETTTPTPDTPLETPARESGRHPVNVGHLVMGVALLGLVAVWALIVGDVVDGDDVRWLLPAPWVLAGAAGLVALAATGHRRGTRRVGWVEPSEDRTADAGPADAGPAGAGPADASPVDDGPAETTTDLSTDISTDTATDTEDETR